MDMQSLRGIERVLVVGIAGLSIYLGYLLFRHMPERSDSEGKLILPGGISIFLSRVGPGVFFALFGALVVALSLRSPVQTATTFKKTTQMAGATQVEEGMSYSSQFGQATPETDKQALKEARLRTREHIIFFNRLPTMLKTNLSPIEQKDFLQETERIKLELMKGIWGDWGDQETYRRFKDWVRRGARGAPPKGLEAAVAFYRYGQKEASP